MWRRKPNICWATAATIPTVAAEGHADGTVVLASALGTLERRAHGPRAHLDVGLSRCLPPATSAHHQSRR